ncbi:ABC transporter ATP-binding protein [Candidatus Fermentibacteria bacterium]|nr:ABC transporter ATP-binding protein [Candidatus Fermentibacteria bacterium]
MTQILISARNMRVRRNGFTLRIDRVDLSQREVLGIIGPNGSGKSTLLRAVSGLLPLHSGAVSICGQDLRNLERKTLAGLIGFLPQDVPLLYPYSVTDTVLLGRYPRLREWERVGVRDREAAAAAMEMTDVADLAHRRIDRLSGGELRRVLLASVLAQEPRVLLLDEPLAGLDIHHSTVFAAALRGLAAQGLGAVLVTHDLSIASLYCDRLLLLVGGEVVACGTPDTVLSPEILASVYGDSVMVMPHPETARPTVVPRYVQCDALERP